MFCYYITNCYYVSLPQVPTWSTSACTTAISSTSSICSSKTTHKDSSASKASFSTRSRPSSRPSSTRRCTRMAQLPAVVTQPKAPVSVWFHRSSKFQVTRYLIFNFSTNFTTILLFDSFILQRTVRILF